MGSWVFVAVVTLRVLWSLPLSPGLQAPRSFAASAGGVMVQLSEKIEPNISQKWETLAKTGSPILNNFHFQASRPVLGGCIWNSGVQMQGQRFSMRTATGQVMDRRSSWNSEIWRTWETDFIWVVKGSRSNFNFNVSPSESVNPHVDKSCDDLLVTFIWITGRPRRNPMTNFFGEVLVGQRSPWCAVQRSQTPLPFA